MTFELPKIWFISKLWKILSKYLYFAPLKSFIFLIKFSQINKFYFVYLLKKKGLFEGDHFLWLGEVELLSSFYR